MGQRTITIRTCDRCARDIAIADEGVYAALTDEGPCGVTRHRAHALLCGACWEGFRVWWDSGPAHPSPPGSGTSSTG